MTTRRRFLLGAAAVGGTAIVGPTVRTASRPVEMLREAWQGSPAQTVADSGLQPTKDEVEATYTQRRNWGRWGPNDQAGAINLMTPQKRVSAAALVQTGRTVSLSRVFEPEQHFVQIAKNELGGFVVDYYGFLYHGLTVTHVDALCHVWDQHGMWNGRSPDKEIDTGGARFADITAFSGGLVTRGVLLDVPLHRREPFVTMDRPVSGGEMEDIARSQSVEIRAGDALLVHCGREAYSRAGNGYSSSPRPGLHVSCAKFIRDHDVALLGWDMLDARPDQYGLRWPVHGVLFNYGVALLDNALLEPLAAACVDERRYEFMFVALPLKVARGTGSPVNPIAMF